MVLKLSNAPTKRMSFNFSFKILAMNQWSFPLIWFGARIKPLFLGIFSRPSTFSIKKLSKKGEEMNLQKYTKAVFMSFYLTLLLKKQSFPSLYQ